jgi:non-specific serine/threonine protein kinase
LPQHKSFKTAHLEKVEFNPVSLIPQFSVYKKDDKFLLECFVKPEAIAFGLNENERPTPVCFFYNHQVYLWENIEALSIAMEFLPSGVKTISAEEWPTSLHKYVLKLAKEYKVDFDKELIEEVKDGAPEVKLFLQEKGEYLVFQPIFTYKGYDTKAKDRDELIVPSGDKVVVVHRNREAEQGFIHRLRTLHSNFVSFDDGAALALKGVDVLKNNWFFLFVDAMNEQKVPVYGFELLKNFRFNTEKPSTRIFISSNTDWFDAKVDILFGDQKVSVAEVKKALANKQQFVPWVMVRLVYCRKSG